MSESFSAPVSTYEVPAPVQAVAVSRPRQRYWLHAVLLLATIFSTLVVGARMQANFINDRPVFSMDDDALPLFPLAWILAMPARLLLGVPFAGTLMLILLAHEMGHYVYCKKYGVYATLPFFIPAPTLIGTLGAFIRIKSPIRSRAALFDIGIAGPIAGFSVAVVTLAIAITLSKPLPANLSPFDIQFGYPVIFELVHRLVSLIFPGPHATVPLAKLSLHPVAVAAWVGMFATALNLLPGGQLDGGHIVFSLAPRMHKWVSRMTIAVLVPLAIFSWVGWLIWAVLLHISGMRHPQVAMWPTPGRSRRWLAVCGLLMLVLTMTVAPFKHESLLDVVRQSGIIRHAPYLR
jgi:Zn-dependent protease